MVGTGIGIGCGRCCCWGVPCGSASDMMMICRLLSFLVPEKTFERYLVPHGVCSFEEDWAVQIKRDESNQATIAKSTSPRVLVRIMTRQDAGGDARPCIWL